MIHSPLFLDLVDRRAVSLDDGFPINSDGRVDFRTARCTQPTGRCLGVVGVRRRGFPTSWDVGTQLTQP